MDSLTQMALGAAVGTAVLGRRIGPKAALWGAVCGTLPDLDVFLSHGGPVRDFTFHRAETHAFFYQTLAAPLIAWLPSKLHRAADVPYWRWVLLVWLALITHALLDALTVYGTQLLLPFSDYPVGLGSIFIIDPVYTLLLSIGLAAALALRTRPRAGERANQAGLLLSTLYLAWSVAAQNHIEGEVQRTLTARQLDHGRVLVTPTPFNTLLWRIVVMQEDSFYEGFTSVFDASGPIEFTRYPRRAELLEPLRSNWNVERLAWFSKGFYAAGIAARPMQARSAIAAAPLHAAHPITAAIAATADEPGAGPRVVMADLRMGQVPWFVFTFIVGRLEGEHIEAVEPQQLSVERPTGRALAWIWHRIWSEAAGPPPRSGAVSGKREDYPHALI